MIKWKYYCPKCRTIKNRFQVAKGTDHVRYYWHRCRDCGTQVVELEDAIRDAIVSTRRLIDEDKSNPLIGFEGNGYDLSECGSNDPTKVVVDWSEVK